MIKLGLIRYANIFAVGNHPIEINLAGHDRTLIIGKNGAGKTTLINALCYVLFGSPYSGVNKGTIINSINKKALLVELEFEIGTKQYLIKRGMKPNIFEIYVDGVMLRQEGAAKDYQKHLEEEILRLNFNAFKQIVVVGSGGFTPFMRLSAGERREIIENILDLRVFSTMNALLKGKNDALKEEISANQDDIDKAELELRYAKKQLDFVREAIEKNREKTQQRNDELETQVKELEQKKTALEDGLIKLQKDLVDIAVVTGKRAVVQRETFKIESELNVIEKQTKFLHTTDNCPTCAQKIDEAFKHQCITANEVVIQDKKNILEQHSAKMVKIETIIEKIQERQAKIDKVRNARDVVDMRLRTLRTTEKEEVREELDDIGKLTDEVIAVSAKKDDFDKVKDSLFKLKELYSLSSVLLKDNGIKSKIISTYIPLMNQFLNQYLDLMNFYVQFEIDENFKEVIKSRYRDEFSYESFSEGEKDRIDLALLFAWREIAKTKNRINVNLLILDEVFDGSMDDAGLDDLDKILKSLGENTNVFVISHKAEIIENFPRILEFTKVKNFSTMKVRNS